MLVYRDHHHLTATFVRSLVDELRAALPVVGDGPGGDHAGADGVPGPVLEITRGER